MSRRYLVTLGSNLDQDLRAIAEKLRVPMGEVMRRALVLMTHASKAKAVILTGEDGAETNVLIK